MSEVMQHVSDTASSLRLSDNAKRHLLKCLSEQENNKGVRFSVKKTGCSGLSYVVDYVTQENENDVILPFEASYAIYIDKASFPYLKGMEIDYVRQGLNHKFVFDNPNQTGQCGCGESFTVE